MADGEAAAKKSDLPVRAASAVVMIALVGGAVWAGGLVFSLFLLALAGGLIWEWWGLVSKIAKTPLGLLGAMLLGIGYIGWSLKVVHWLWVTPHPNTFASYLFLCSAAMVVAVDIGAYFAGRTFGGPKIAPSVSPSKTWSGLLGGIASASVLLLGLARLDAGFMDWRLVILSGICGAAIAVFAQAGDFLESWMKRRAGVKDSGHVIPGHGGLLDRLDGHLMVFAVLPVLAYAFIWLATFLFQGIR